MPASFSGGEQATTRRRPVWQQQLPSKTIGLGRRKTILFLTSGFGEENQQQEKLCMCSWLYQQAECGNLLDFQLLYLNATRPNLPSRGSFSPVFLWEVPADFLLLREKQNNNNNKKPYRRLNSPLSLPVFGWFAYRSPLQNKIARTSPTIIPTKISRSFRSESHHSSALVRRKKV